MQGKTGKIVLAVLGVILMIVFILPASMQGLPGADPTLGKLSDQEVRQSDILNASRLFDYASENILVPVAEGQLASLTDLVFQNFARRLHEDPELFYLLLEEAQRTGATMPRDPLVSQLTLGGVEVVIRDRSAPGGQQRVPFADLAGEQLREQVLLAAGAVLSVDRSLGMHADVARVSAPVVDYYIAIQSQRAAMKTVVFDAANYLQQAPAPSAEAMWQHFEKYKDNLAGRSTPQNPFGFGYRLPDRVKLQYITVSGEAVREHVIAGMLRTPIADRTQTLFGYWKDNRARFPVPTTQPATNPATQPARQPSQSADGEPETQPAEPTEAESAPGDGGMMPGAQDERAQTAAGTQPPAQDPPATQPTTEPAPPAPEAPLLATDPVVRQFLDQQATSIRGKSGEADWQAFMAVHDQVVQRYLSQQAGELRTNISKRLRDLVISDYRAFDLARTATTRPRTRVGTPVDELEYFDRVADALATEFGVRPKVSTYARDYLTFEQAQEEEHVGSIATSFAPMELQLTMFANYVFGLTLELLEADGRDRAERGGAALSLLQPSLPMTDLSGSEHVFRIIEAHGDAEPASIAEVEEQVREDLQRLAAYEVALEQANAFAEQARSTSLGAAAEAAGLAVHDPVAFAPGAGIADVRALGAAEDETIGVAARNDLADSFYRMITDPAVKGVERPIGVLPMRPAFRVIVAELEDLVAGWIDESGLARLRDQRQQELSQQLMSIAAPVEDFFDFDRVAKRVGYVREQPRTPADGAPEADEPPAADGGR